MPALPSDSSPELLATVRHVAVGSTNPVKIAAARAVLARVAPAASVAGIAVPSGVPDQPWGDDETIRGALARAAGALAAAPHAGLGIGFEGGVVAAADGTVRTCAWAAVVAVDGTHGVGGSLAMPLPAAVGRRLRDGEELGHAMDAHARTTGSKHAGGAVGILTRGLIDRQGAYEVILTYALARFLTPALWTDADG